jgi:crotonobetainyl-CoA:carnitine CoA-transferase CaiB-like acyl-CoA transferase
MLGLAARAATGRGQYLETSMLASTGYILSTYLIQYEGAPAWQEQAADRNQRGLSARYRIYRGSSGWLFIAAVQDREWKALCDTVGLEAHPVGLARNDDSREVETELEQIFATCSATEWVERLQAEEVPAVLVSELPTDGWLVKNGFLLPAEHDSFGSYWRSPAKIDFSEAKPCLRPAAGVGEHTRSVLRELGYDDNRIDRLVKCGVLGEQHSQARS